MKVYTFTNHHDRKFSVELYGKIIAFFDITNKRRLVSEYYLSTLLERNSAFGLDLYGGVDEWKVSADDLNKVLAFLTANN